MTQYPTQAHHYLDQGRASLAWLAITAARVIDCGHDVRRFEARDGSAVVVTRERQALGVHRDRLDAARPRYAYGALITAAAVADGHGLTMDDALPA